MYIRALKAFSNGSISMYKDEVRDVADATAEDLIAQELAVEFSSGGGSGGGVLVVHDVDGTLDKTWQEIHDAFVAGSVRIQNAAGVIMNVKTVGYSSKEGKYSVMCDYYQTDHTCTTDSASGYPTNAYNMNRERSKGKTCLTK